MYVKAVSVLVGWYLYPFKIKKLHKKTFQKSREYTK